LSAKPEVAGDDDVCVTSS